MKNILKKGVLFLFSLLMISCTQNKKKSESFVIHRGVNLSHWLSQDFGWYPRDEFITENDIRFIDSIGYDHVRIPIDEFEMWDESGAPIEESFNYLTSCLDWCAKYNLRAVVDLHILKSHHFNADNEGGNNTLWTDTVEQDNFINLWREISARLKKYPNHMVAYELMNEAVAPSHEDWNLLMAKAVKAIRELEPERVLVIGSNMWQIAETFPYLKVPENDKNIILSVHTYTPMVFTHYLADWTPLKNYKGPVSYPGRIVSQEDYNKYVDMNNEALVKSMEESKQVFNKDVLYESLLPAIEKARELNLKLYCGEFGCLPHVNRTDRLQYYDDIISVFEENDIAWANWEYKGDFGLYYFDFENIKVLDPDWEFIETLLKER
jgi:endoglucanase